jgi:probable addiction module antidote protein
MPRARQLVDELKYRDNPKQIAKYLNDALATEDTAAVVRAIGDMIRAQGSSGFSKKTNLGRASLYRSFSGRMSPGFERVVEVLLALEVKLIAKPLTK